MTEREPPFGDDANRPQAPEATDPNPDEASSPAQDLFKRFLWFRATLDGIRELESAIKPHVAALDSFEPRVRALVESTPLPPDLQRRLADALIKSAKRAPDQISEPRANGATEQNGELQGTASGDTADETPTSAETGLPDDVAALLRESGVVFELMRGFHAAGTAPRAPMLYGALLVLAVATFESLLGTIYGQHFTLHPAALDAQEKEFSLGELQEFADISDAREALIGRKVDAFRQQSLSEWSRWSARTLKASFDDLAVEPAALNEYFQRRHVIVHSAGTVSRQYLARVDFGSETPPPLSNPLPVTSDYLARAIDEFDVVGSLLALLAWQKWVSDESERVATFAHLASYDLLTSESWNATRHVCARAQDLLDLPHSIDLLMRVNEWLARKRLDGVDSIRAEVERWDVSALSGRFRLARLALLDDLDALFELLPTLVEQREVTLENVANWPLLHEARQDDRIRPMLERFSS